ncbi:MAG: bifunctional serine/threonine-protein kinase/formylglycine-generating enzyme family protein [Verrucomicrobiota bacterium]
MASQIGNSNIAPGQKVGAGRFTLIRPLGAGGMGQVWLAQDEELSKEVALKFLSAEVSNNPEALRGMRNEVAKAQALTHVNIVRIHDLHKPAGETGFISMEYVEGKSLHALLVEQPQELFTWEKLRPWVQQLCDGLAHAHSQGVVHRDLKPANLLVDATGALKLVDFGIAATGVKGSGGTTGLTERRQILGTPWYMSPQQLDGKPAEPVDDIYSLGATLYQLLTGETPYTAHPGAMKAILETEVVKPIPERLRELKREAVVPLPVTQTVMACLEKEPGKRPPSAKAVWEGLSPDEAKAGKSVWNWKVGLVAVALLIVGAWLAGVLKSSQPSEKNFGDSVNQPTKAFLSASKDHPWTNSLGMPFAPVPGTKVLFGIWVVRVQDYQKYAEANPSVDSSWKSLRFAQDGIHPVVKVSWNDAKAFCAWLTKKEQREGKLAAGQEYRLPTDAEWSYAVGIGDKEENGTPGSKDGRLPSIYPWGTQWPPPKGAGNYAKLNVDDFEYTSPVGSFQANQFGLYDMGGNVWQWCEDYSNGQSGSRVMRGASWISRRPGDLPSSRRINFTPAYRYYDVGFRVVVAGP